jgi:torulene dioxygenase
MATASVQIAQAAPYNNYFVGEKDLKYVPPYLKDSPETPKEVECETEGAWPKWVNGTFMR